MSPGKLAAQAGHAFLDTYEACRARDSPLASEYLRDGHGTKVVLSAPTLDDLLALYERARELGLPCALITDSGHIMPPHFNGQPIITALGIGPARRDQIKSLTKRLALLR